MKTKQTLKQAVRIAFGLFVALMWGLITIIFLVATGAT